jgi:hypothetical protein
MNEPPEPGVYDVNDKKLKILLDRWRDEMNEHPKPLTTGSTPHPPRGG